MQSRILYDQMLGRATRLCTDIGKTHFNIYDAVGIYDNLKSYTDMKPVVKQQNYSIDDLYQSLANANDEKADFYRDQLIAKIQRKKQRLPEEAKQKFTELTNGKSIDDWAHELQSVTPEVARKQELLFEYVSQYRTQGEKYIFLTMMIV